MILNFLKKGIIVTASVLVLWFQIKLNLNNLIMLHKTTIDG